jgi:hypothetical protein
MSDVLTLLDKMELILPQYIRDYQSEVKRLEKAYQESRYKRNDMLGRLQGECHHPVILEAKGGRGYDAGGCRMCYVCGLYESQPMSDAGDEYKYATYGSYKILTGSQYGYMPAEGREVYQVDQSEIMKRRKYKL